MRKSKERIQRSTSRLSTLFLKWSRKEKKSRDERRHESVMDRERVKEETVSRGDRERDRERQERERERERERESGGVLCAFVDDDDGPFSSTKYMDDKKRRHFPPKPKRRPLWVPGKKQDETKDRKKRLVGRPSSSIFALFSWSVEKTSLLSPPREGRETPQPGRHNICNVFTRKTREC